jgi:hypothetical protein
MAGILTHQAVDNLNRPISALCPAGVKQKITVDAGNNASAAFAAGVTVIRVVSTVDCWYDIAASAPVAADGDVFLPAGVIEYVNVPLGWAIAFTRNGATSGFASVVEMI